MLPNSEWCTGGHSRMESERVGGKAPVEPVDVGDGSTSMEALAPAGSLTLLEQMDAELERQNRSVLAEFLDVSRPPIWNQRKRDRWLWCYGYLKQQIKMDSAADRGQQGND